jgi:SAM-dependent methyltransferase
MPLKMPPEHYRSLAEREDHYWWHQSRYRLALASLRRHGRRPAGLRVADVGCGTGGFLRHLQQRGVRDLAGFDYSAEVLEGIRSDGIRTAAVDFEQRFDLPGGPWDVVSCLDVLEHIRDEDGFLQSVRANLVPGGCLVLTVPAHAFLFSEWDRQLQHFRRYSRRGLRQRLEKSGFRVREVSCFFSFVLPVALARKWVGYHDGREGCEFPPVPAALNRLLLTAATAERWWLAAGFLPLGTSVFALAERTDG